MKSLTFLNTIFAVLLIAIFTVISVNPYQLLLISFLLLFTSLGIFLSKPDIIKASGLTTYIGFFILAYLDPPNTIMYLFSGILVLFFADIFTATNEINDINSLSQSLMRIAVYYMSMFILFIVYYIVTLSAVKISVSLAGIALTITLYVFFRRILKEYFNTTKYI